MNYYLSSDKKAEVMATLQGATITEQRRIVESMGLKNCYKNGNKAIVDIEKVDAMIKTEKDVDFVASAPSSWLGKLQHCKTAEERFAAIEMLSAETYGKAFTASMVKAYAKRHGMKVTKPSIPAYNAMSSMLGISTGAFTVAKAGTMPTAMIKNLVANITAKINKSSSKKIKAMDIQIIENPTKAQLNALGVSYNGTNKRPDMVICYTVGKERKFVFFEHFGWEGSDAYNKAQSAKLAMAANEGFAFFASFSRKANKHVNVVDFVANESDVFGRVLNWNADNTFVGGASPMDNIYTAVSAAMTYVGAPTMMPKFDQAFKK